MADDQQAVQDELSSTIRAIGSGGFWERLSALIASTIPFDNIIVIAFHLSGRPMKYYKASLGADVFALLDDTYMKGAYVFDPVYHFHQAGGASGVYGLDEVAPDNFRNTDYFQNYYGILQIIDEINIIERIDQETSIAVAIGRDGRSETPFSSEDRGKIDRHSGPIRGLIHQHYAQTVRRPVPVASSRNDVDKVMTALKQQFGIEITPRQAEIGLKILEGHSNLSISHILSISPETVKVHRRLLYQRCNISSQAELFNLILPIMMSEPQG